MDMSNYDLFPEIAGQIFSRALLLLSFSQFSRSNVYSEELAQMWLHRVVDLANSSADLLHVAMAWKQCLMGDLAFSICIVTLQNCYRFNGTCIQCFKGPLTIDAYSHRTLQFTVSVCQNIYGLFDVKDFCLEYATVVKFEGSLICRHSRKTPEPFHFPSLNSLYRHLGMDCYGSRIPCQVCECVAHALESQNVQRSDIVRIL